MEVETPAGAVTVSLHPSGKEAPCELQSKRLKRVIDGSMKGLIKGPLGAETIAHVDPHLHAQPLRGFMFTWTFRP